VSVRCDDNGSIVLDGFCPVEDAESLLQLFQAYPTAQCDWTQCGHLHTAVVQVVLAVRPIVIGPCGDPWIEQWIGPFIAEED
jgi:hypothetical protein